MLVFLLYIGLEARLNQCTKRRMLKGECDDILDPLDGHRKRIAWKAFTDYNFDAAEVIGGVPVILSKEFLAEAWKSKRLKVSVL